MAKCPHGWFVICNGFVRQILHSSLSSVVESCELIDAVAVTTLFLSIHSSKEKKYLSPLKF